MLNLIEK